MKFSLDFIAMYVDTGKTVVYQLFRNVLGLASYKFCPGLIEISTALGPGLIEISTALGPGLMEISAALGPGLIENSTSLRPRLIKLSHFFAEATTKLLLKVKRNTLAAGALALELHPKISGWNTETGSSELEESVVY